MGASLVVVGNGKPHHAKAFIEEEKLEFPLYVDPHLKAYELAGLKRGVVSTFFPTNWGNAIQAMKDGHRQHKQQGDPWQQGGVFVIVQPESKVSFAYISATAGDHPSTDSIVDALK